MAAAYALRRGVNIRTSNGRVNAGGYEDKIYVEDIIKKGIKLKGIL